MPPPSTGAGASLNGNRPFHAGSTWNQDVTTWAVHPSSNLWISILDYDFDTVAGGITLHPEFGQGLWNGATIGLPYIVVPANQPMVTVTAVDYPDESDPGPMPIPADAPVEGAGGSNPVYDRHVMVLQLDPAKPNGLGYLYELFDAVKTGGSAWNCANAAIWDLNGPGWGTRPIGWTSADAAGLPIFPGLARYDVINSGTLNHALRFTATHTKLEYVAPATHYASFFTPENPPPNLGPLAGMSAAARANALPPMGLRLRLKASYAIPSEYPTHVKTILTGLKKYGMILADNGGGMFITGAPDERWNNDQLAFLGEVGATNFEAVIQPAILPGSEAMPAPVTLIKRGGGSTRLTAGDFDANMIEIEDWTAAAEAELNALEAAANVAGPAKRYVDLRDFTGIDFSGNNDATTDVNTALLQAYTAGYACEAPAGSIRVSTARLPTKVHLVGAGPGLTFIKGDGSNSPIIKSKNLFTGDAHAGLMQGRSVVRDLTVIGSDDQALSSQHGIVLRDYFSNIFNVEINMCGGNAIRFTEVNDAGTRTGVGVNNQIRDVAIYMNRGLIALMLGDSGTIKMTDGLLENVYVNSARTGSNSGYTQVYVGNSAGWRFRNVHTYSYHDTVGSLVTPHTVMHIVKPYHTQMRDMYLENWTNVALYVEGGASMLIDGFTAICEGSIAGGNGIYIDGSVTLGNPVVTLGQVLLSKATGTQAVNPLTSDHNARVNLSSPISFEGARTADFQPNRKLNGGTLWTPADAGGTWNSV